MGLFRRKDPAGNATRDNIFLKDFAIKLNGLMRYTEDNEKVTASLKRLQNDFQFTIATTVKDAKKLEVAIEKKYDVLKKMLQEPEWDEVAVLKAIQNIGVELDELNATRR